MALSPDVFSDGLMKGFGSVLHSAGLSAQMLPRLFPIWFADLGDFATLGYVMGGVTPRIAHPGTE